MYSKPEAAALTQQFWTAFGRYMAPVLSAEGERINWVNYKTGKKDIRFVMSADHVSAHIDISLSHKDPGLQRLYFEEFARLKESLHQVTREEWQWRLFTKDLHGKTTSRIGTTLQPVNILNRPDWPRIISFLKPRMIALDTFWCGFKYAFEGKGF